jgi:hypothetical protein
VQAQGNVQASIGIGSAPNRVKIYIKSDITQTSNISTVEFNIAIPETENVTKPTVTSSTSSISWQIADPVTEGGYKNYAITKAPGAILTFEFTAGSEFEVMELEFPDQSIVPNSVSLVTLPLGGNNGFSLFYCTGSPSSDGSNLYYSRTDATYRTDVINGFSYNDAGTQGTDISSATLIAKTTPVKLSSFSVIAKNNNALLNWSVENQDANSSHFEIERSANGIDFNQVATVNATSNTQESYSYTDDNSNLAGAVYYRLKMVDKDGQFAYSDIKSVQFANAAFAVSLYPNPVQNLTKLKVTLDEAQVIKVSVNNALGNLVKQYQITGQKGNNEKTIDLSDVPSGSYMIRIQAGQSTKTLPVIKN